MGDEYGTVVFPRYYFCIFDRSVYNQITLL